MKLKTFLTSATLALALPNAMAVPAKPGIHTFTQPDGTVIEASLVGDEHFHYYRMADGTELLRDADGFLRKADASQILSMQNKAIAKEATMPGTIRQTFPTTGTVRGLIIMAEFQDKKFLPKTTREYIDTKVNSENFVSDEALGSVVDYFREQSGGAFTPVFDVVGPVTLPKKCADYGLTEDLVNFYRDACIAADTQAGVDFSIYDVNNDDFVDFVFVIFAGHGEAQGGSSDCIWPAMMYLENSVYDYFDDKNLNVAACACELKDAEGEEWDGVGTICHEFSHILGLPDVYDARYSGGYGMGHYDMMDVGPYNADGRIPAGYTAMDRYTVGWLDPVVLSEPAKDVELPSLVESNKAYFIVNPDNGDEYYTLENRQPVGFDAGLPGHGLIISHIHYDPKIWSRNTVNSPSQSGYEHIQLMAADNKWIANPAGEAADPFPGTDGVTEFTDDTTPAATWHTGSSAKVGKPVTNIRENSDGLITFDFDMLNSGISRPGTAGETGISGGSGFIIAPRDARIYTLAGIETTRTGLAPGIYLVKTADRCAKVIVR